MTIKSAVKGVLSEAYESVTHLIGRATGRYYFEDWVRVYPDNVAYSRLGFRVRATKEWVNNYLNHRKFYAFAAQFVMGNTAADIGCGSGYGCEMLKQAGATRVIGCDISKRAISYAKRRFGGSADFFVKGITDLHGIHDDSVDVTISSEVLEHIKEYGMEAKAMLEMHRITKAGGIVVVGTPNAELLPNHGFSFVEIDRLFAATFRAHIIFENALVPFSEAGKQSWAERQRDRRTGLVVSQNINLAETCLPSDGRAELKQGVPVGTASLNGLEIDTTKIHNTHSWIVVAIK